MSSTIRAVRVSALDEVPGLVHGFEQRVVTLARNEFALAIELGGPFGPPKPPTGAESSEGSRRRVAEALRPFGRLHLLKQLRAAGMAEERLHRVADCTYCRADLYHSYRREGRGAGRMINYVGFTA